MKVGVYVGHEGPMSGGSHSFVRAVLDGIAGLGAKHSFEILHSGLDDVPRVGSLPVRRIGGRRRHIALRIIDRMQPGGSRAVRDRVITAELEALGYDLLWFLTPAYLPTTLPYVATVWDLAHRVEPAFPEVRASGWTWEVREGHYQRWLPRATYVVVGASVFAEDVSRCYGVSPMRIRVIPLVSPPRTATENPPASADSRPFIFYPAQFWPHKNHVGLLIALKEVREKHQLDLRLVLTGSDKGNLAHVRSVISDLGLSGDVSIEGFVSDERLAALYSHATALVFPSFFGPDNLPPLEAMQLGCPVIAADVPGAREQFGDAAVLVDHRNAGDMAAAIVKVCQDATFRTALIQRGRECVRRWTPAAYAAAIVRTVDEFETERQCWSYTTPYIHK